ncbi:MAG: glutathione S-transferase family protein [Nostoc sp. ZfuVER08]|jgi:glutathione S-transferase|uniref:glutathione transferase n=1 Tax=Nostoc punctiforme FACHB-252 TaxID=1357509 RepID=A0ABR8HIW4_NOSPU|nr:glutathione S-transferase family protein [Nostoc punctiforme]MBD2615164.1 glutathione S-transferase family protein [Nostoc punctiforme FACHB-252]MDZ8015773.1 glutathione S-transferase family protein [Nostoc sp. ZfuVER08]
MSSVVIHGFPVSPYVRSARIVLIEKGIDYRFNEIGFDYLKTDEYAKLNPFGRMPVLEHGDFVLYETPAILGYVDEAFAGPSLQPTDAKARAQVRKWIGIAANYLYTVGVMQLFLQRIMSPIMGGIPDEVVVAESANITSHHLDVLEKELATSFIVGNTLTLADIITGSMVYYVNMTKEGSALIKARPKTAAWLDNLSQRQSFQQTLAGLLEGKAQG